MSVKSLGLRPWLQNALENVQIRTLTDIQKEALPQALQGKDVLGKLTSQRYDRNR